MTPLVKILMLLSLIMSANVWASDELVCDKYVTETDYLKSQGEWTYGGFRVRYYNDTNEYISKVTLGYNNIQVDSPTSSYSIQGGVGPRAWGDYKFDIPEEQFDKWTISHQKSVCKKWRKKTLFERIRS